MDLHRIDLNLLVAFDALMAERSVTLAGKRVGLSQSAMSAALSRLRGLFEDELFVRGAGALQPTTRAIDLAEPLRRALEEIQHTLAYAGEFDPSSSTIAFSLALSEHPAFVLLPGLLDCLHRIAPQVTLQVRAFSDRDDAIALLDAGEVSAAVGVTPRGALGRILTRPLFKESFVCVVRKGHPVLANPLDLRAFLQLSHLLVSPEHDRFGHVDAALAEQGMKRKLVLTLPQMYAAPPLVARSDMIATLMAGVVTASGYAESLCVLQPPVHLEPLDFVICWHRRNDVHPAQVWFRDCVVLASAQIGCCL